MQNSTEENQKDWYKASMIFANALGIILEEEHGIIVDLDDTLSIPGIDGIDGINKVIIFRKENQVHIAPCTEDIAEGETVILNPTEPTDELPDGV